MHTVEIYVGMAHMAHEIWETLYVHVSLTYASLQAAVAHLC